ncbi:hypothetical protein CSA37_11015 [Candidatus Fermentibacteria bacterium]|nr:MAG: hypothetical protein CSA37_11015 [Candidatus Fermentibacteria bacterium]
MKYSAFCKFDLEATGRKEAIEELLKEFPFGTGTRSLISGALDIREQVGATVVHKGISLPHCRSILVDSLTIAVGHSRKGISWPDEKVHVVILFVSPVKPSAPEAHAVFLSHIAGVIRKSGNEICSAETAEDLFRLLDFEHLEQED